MVKLNPYLKFNGNCEEAFNFYKAVLGGEFAHVSRYSEMPHSYDIPEDMKNKIMHIMLPISHETVLMGEDASEAFGGPVTVGSNFSVSISAESAEEAQNIFQGLSVGGHIQMPFEETFWGSLFGMFTDKFGVSWMVSSPLQKS